MNNHKGNKSTYKEDQWNWPEDANVSGVAWPKEKRIEHLAYIAERIGLHNINKKELAKKFGVNRDTLYEDLKKLYTVGVPPEVMERAKLNIVTGITLSVRTAEKAMVDAVTPADKVKAAQAYAAILQIQTELLEKWELKKQITEQVDNNITIQWKPRTEVKPLRPENIAFLKSKEQERKKSLTSDDENDESHSPSELASSSSNAADPHTPSSNQ